MTHCVLLVSPPITLKSHVNCGQIMTVIVQFCHLTYQAQVHCKLSVNLTLLSCDGCAHSSVPVHQTLLMEPHYAELILL